MESNYSHNILTFIGLFIGVMLSILAINKKPLLSFRNISVFLILSYTIVGILFLPDSLILEKYDITSPQLYLSSINKSVFYHILGLWIFLISIISLDLKKRNYSIDNMRYLKLLSFSEKIEYLRARKILTLTLIVLFGSILIYGSFWYTGNIPYCNLIDTSAKYFSGFTERYIQIRPFYVFGQQTLAIVGFFLLYISIKTLKAREFKKTAIYLFLFLVSSFSLLLTMKRGEIFLPFTIYIGGLILLNRIKISQIALMILILICLAFILDPAQSKRPLTKLVCGNSLREVSNLSGKSPSPNLRSNIQLTDLVKKLNQKTSSFVLNSFCVQVRDSSRLLYNFTKQKGSYLYGKTFIAGMLGFIPTSIFSFKEENQIGRVTLRLFGLNPETSGGPRIGIIGESYINFGITGVLIIPGILGLFVWFIDKYYMWIYENDSGEHKLLHMSFMYIILSHFCTGIYLDGSGALQTFIIRLGIILFILFSLLTKLKINSKRNS
jgi:hypothetical protein